MVINLKKSNKSIKNLQLALGSSYALWGNCGEGQNKCYIYSMEHTTRNKNIVLTHNPWGWDRVNPWGWEKGCVKNILKFFRQIIQK